MPTDAERPDSTTTAAVDGECRFSQSDSLKVCFCLLLFHIAYVSFCGVKVNPQMQGIPSEVTPVAPNSQSAPAVSPQVCYSTSCIPESVTASVIQINFDDDEHFYKQSSARKLSVRDDLQRIRLFVFNLIRVFSSSSGYD